MLRETLKGMSGTDVMFMKNLEIVASGFSLVRKKSVLPPS
jgi:hypothetical protein